MGNPSENHRVLPRHKGNVLCEDVNHAAVPLIDMTTKGISFIGSKDFQPGEVVNLWLISAADKKDTVETLCRIVNVFDDRVSAVFIERTERLENFIVTHIIDDPPLIQD
jgi:hypothetical protein